MRCDTNIGMIYFLPYSVTWMHIFLVSVNPDFFYPVVYRLTTCSGSWECRSTWAWSGLDWMQQVRDFHNAVSVGLSMSKRFMSHIDRLVSSQHMGLSSFWGLYSTFGARVDIEGWLLIAVQRLRIFWCIRRRGCSVVPSVGNFSTFTENGQSDQTLRLGRISFPIHISI